MPDLEAALVSVRGDLEAVDRRLEELDRQRADLERQREEFSAAVRVMERLSSRAARGSPADDSATEVPLTQRVLDTIADAGVATRADLRRRFCPEVNPNTLDSTVRRLVGRGSLRRDGRRLFPVVGSAEPGSADTALRVVPKDSGAEQPRDALAPVVPEAARGPAGSHDDGGSVADDRSRKTVPTMNAPTTDADKAVPLTVRVLEAVATSVAHTRRGLVQHFAAQGVKEASVDTALSGLRKRGKLERRAGGVLALPGSADSSAPPKAVSPDS